MNITTTLYIEHELIWDTVPVIVGEEVSALAVEVSYTLTDVVPATWYDPEEGGDIEDLEFEVVGYYRETTDINNLGPIEVTAEQAAVITAKLYEDIEYLVLEQLE